MVKKVTLPDSLKGGHVPLVPPRFHRLCYTSQTYFFPLILCILGLISLHRNYMANSETCTDLGIISDSGMYENSSGPNFSLMHLNNSHWETLLPDIPLLLVRARQWLWICQGRGRWGVAAMWKKSHWGTMVHSRSYEQEGNSVCYAGTVTVINV